MADSTANNGTVFHTHTLHNGLQIVGQPMPDFESVAASFYVRTGSRDEPDQSIAGRPWIGSRLRWSLIRSEPN